MITTVSKIFSVHVGLLKLFTVLYLLHKYMPNSNKCIQLCTKPRIKTLANRKKMNKNTLNATGLKLTSFDAKTLN